MTQKLSPWAEKVIAQFKSLEPFGFGSFEYQDSGYSSPIFTSRNEFETIEFSLDRGTFNITGIIREDYPTEGLLGRLIPFGFWLQEDPRVRELPVQSVPLIKLPSYVATWCTVLVAEAPELLLGDFRQLKDLQFEYYINRVGVETIRSQPRYKDVLEELRRRGG